MSPFPSASILFFAVVILSSAFTAFPAFATIRIPKNLTESDRIQAARILGLGVSSKILSDPYPLGGYDGFEFGVGASSLQAADLGRLGSKLPDPQSDVTYPVLSFGKGLYNDLDFYLHFTPFTQANALSQYGAIARWGFYQASFLPASISILIHGNAANISNVIVSRAIGFDLVAGINVDNFAVYVGGGPAQASVRFLGGTQGVTAPSAGGTGADEQVELVNSFHSVIGATLRFEEIFAAAQIDRYTEPVYSVKLGVRL